MARLRSFERYWEYEVPVTPAITSVAVKNYKSLARCHFRLGALTLLVGPNGSGKSNCLDALRFVADALNTTVENALRERGGVDAVRRRSRGHPTHFGVRVDFRLPQDGSGFFAFEIGAEANGGFVVQREECRVRGGGLFADAPLQEHYFTALRGRLTSASETIRFELEPDRLALVALSGLPTFRPAYDLLRRMGFYNLDPQVIRDLQAPDPGHVLARDGRNLASVVRELARGDGGRVLLEVREHLAAVVSGIEDLEHKALGPRETIEFRQAVRGSEQPWRFLAENMSDGTLRALGVLVAAFQGGANGQARVSLVGIEEPESALHPGAAQVIASALLLASQRTQILATTHSPDLLDHNGLTEEHLLAVSSEAGETVVGPLAPAVRAALCERLYSAGELLARGQLEPNRELATTSAQLDLFSGDAT